MLFFYGFCSEKRIAGTLRYLNVWNFSRERAQRTHCFIVSEEVVV